MRQIQKQAEGFDIEKMDLDDIFSDISEFDLPGVFENEVLPEDEGEDLSKWDDLSQQCIHIARKQGFIAAWQKVIDEDGVNHALITGRPLVGKTSGGLSLGKQLSHIFQQVFDERNTMGGSAVPLKIELIHKLFPHITNFKNFIIFIDEIQHAFHRMRGQSEGNVDANKFFDTVRKLGIHTILTTPSLNSVDKYIVEEKILWWIHCYKKDKKNKLIYAVVYFNACSKGGKDWEFIECGHVAIRWVNSELYFKVTERISNKEIFAVEGIKEHRAVVKAIAQEARKEQKTELAKAIMDQPISVYRKAYRFLDAGIFTDTDILGHLRRLGLSHGTLMTIKKQWELGVKEKDIKIKKRRGRATDSR